MATIKKDTLHPENEPEVDIYPKTSIDQVENLQANLDALNGDIANANSEISAVSNRVYANERNITDLQQDVDKNIMDIATAESNIQGLQGSVSTIAEKVDTTETELVQLTEQVERVGNQTNENTSDISNLNTAYNSYNDYTIVSNGFLLTYLSGKQIELPIKAGTNVTFSKYPGSNQIIINSTGGSVPDNIALLDAANTFTAQNTFNKLTYFKDNVFFQNIPASFEDSTRKLKLLLNYNGFIKSNRDTGNTYNITFPNQTGTIALTTDIPSLADYPTTIFFNNYNAGIGYKDISTGTIKTVVSTDNNGAQIVLGDSNTGLTLATNARPKVLEDSTVKEVAYVSDIPNTSSFPTLAGNNKWAGDNIFDGFSKSIRVNGLFQVSGDEELISATYNQVSYDGFNIAYMDGENQNIFHIGIDFENKARFGFDKYDGSSYNLYIPEKDGTIALLSDIPSTSSFPTLTGNNTWAGKNIFNNGITTGITKYADYITYRQYIFNFPNKNGTLALVEDIPSGTSQDFSTYSDYEVVDKGFLLTYVDGSKFELPIKAGTNVTFSKYPNTNQVVINATGGNGGGDVYTSANNTFTGNNYFNGQVICANNKGLDIKSGVGTYRFIGLDNDCGITIIKPDLKIYRLVIPDKNGTLSTVEDIPISLMYSSSRLGVNSVDFPFNIDKNYFFTITMTNTGESKSFIYAKGINATYTIVVNSSTSFEVKLDATGSSTRLIFTNKSNADPFVVRAEISN